MFRHGAVAESRPRLAAPPSARARIRMQGDWFGRPPRLPTKSPTEVAGRSAQPQPSADLHSAPLTEWRSQWRPLFLHPRRCTRAHRARLPSLPSFISSSLTKTALGLHSEFTDHRRTRPSQSNLSTTHSSWLAHDASPSRPSLLPPPPAPAAVPLRLAQSLAPLPRHDDDGQQRRRTLWRGLQG